MIKTFFLVGYICSYAFANFVDPFCLSYSEEYPTQVECEKRINYLDMQARTIKTKVLASHQFKCLMTYEKSEVF